MMKRMIVLMLVILFTKIITANDFRVQNNFVKVRYDNKICIGYHLEEGVLVVPQKCVLNVGDAVVSDYDETLFSSVELIHSNESLLWLKITNKDLVASLKPGLVDESHANNDLVVYNEKDQKFNQIVLSSDEVKNDTRLFLKSRSWVDTGRYLAVPIFTKNGDKLVGFIDQLNIFYFWEMSTFSILDKMKKDPGVDYKKGNLDFNNNYIHMGIFIPLYYSLKSTVATNNKNFYYDIDLFFGFNLKDHYNISFSYGYINRKAEVEVSYKKYIYKKISDKSIRITPSLIYSNYLASRIQLAEFDLALGYQMINVIPFLFKSLNTQDQGVGLKLSLSYF